MTREEAYLETTKLVWEKIAEDLIRESHLSEAEIEEAQIRFQKAMGLTFEPYLNAAIAGKIPSGKGFMHDAFSSVLGRWDEKVSPKNNVSVKNQQTNVK